MRPGRNARTSRTSKCPHSILTSCPDCVNDDEFMQTLTVDVAGTYSYVYRFSEDGGYTFIFCDFQPGTSDGFSTDDLGSLTVDP